jgi:hypothetical protein
MDVSSESESETESSSETESNSTDDGKFCQSVVIDKLILYSIHQNV